MSLKPSDSRPAQATRDAPCTPGPPRMVVSPAPPAGERQLDVQRLPDYRDRLFRAAYAMCGRREDAEDLVQDTFVRVLRRPRFLRRDDDLAYLLKVLRNTWINNYEARRRRPATVHYDGEVDFIVDPHADPSATLTEVHAVYAALRQLSDPLRDTLVAVDVVGLSYRQAASALGVPQGTIMSRLYRARNRVAEQLEGDRPTPQPE